MAVVYGFGNDDLKEKAVFILSRIFRPRRNSSSVDARGWYVGETAHAAFAFIVCLDEEASLFGPLHGPLGANSPILAIIDRSAIHKRWLRRSEAEFTERRSSIANVAEVVIPNSLLQSQCESS